MITIFRVLNNLLKSIGLLCRVHYQITYMALYPIRSTAKSLGSQRSRLCFNNKQNPVNFPEQIRFEYFIVKLPFGIRSNVYSRESFLNNTFNLIFEKFCANPLQLLLYTCRLGQ
ncbi:hypothetical protein DF046_19950 [Burkholderia cepacia]|nr:hypothetical protein DF046_19950 [Burkholderia cepacia]